MGISHNVITFSGEDPVRSTGDSRPVVNDAGGGECCCSLNDPRGDGRCLYHDTGGGDSAVVTSSKHLARIGKFDAA